MHLLLTNDDGFDAPGLRCLRRAAVELGADRITVVAPLQEQSMCGHRLTTREPIKVAQMEPDFWTVDGTPGDCVRIGLHALGLKPDWVLSGVNAGGNLGQDMVISGTCAAAREAAYHGVPAAALSHYMRREWSVDWERCAQWSASLLRGLLQQPCPNGRWWCVNFPHLPAGDLPLPECVQAVAARSPLPVAFVEVDGGFLYQADYSSRGRDRGSDVEACFGGRVSMVWDHV